jgi:molybdopterin/thiamine biosynthesis adenylyltransferase
MSIDSAQALARTALLIRSDFLPDASDEIVANTFTTTRVCVRADVDSASTAAGQTAIVTTAIICAQLGAQLVLDLPDVELVVPQPPLRTMQLRSGLLELTSDLIVAGEVGTAGDFSILIGNAACRHESADTAIRISGGDWWFSLERSGSGLPWTGTAPFGALLAATAAGAETFRFLVRRLAVTRSLELLREHRVGPPLPSALTLPQVPSGPIDMGAVDAISAGALTTAMTYALLRIPEAQAEVRLIDADIGALSNLNRYLLLRRSLLGQPKAAALAGYATSLLRISAHCERFDDETLADLVPLASHVVMGVDDIPSRWLVQQNTSHWVGVAATSHLEVVVSEHMPDSACAGCLHPHDDEGDEQAIPTVSFVSAFAGFLLAYRLIRAVSAGPEPSATLAYPFNLSAPLAVKAIPLAPRPDCPVGCAASRAMS